MLEVASWSWWRLQVFSVLLSWPLLGKTYPCAPQFLPLANIRLPSTNINVTDTVPVAVVPLIRFAAAYTRLACPGYVWLSLVPIVAGCSLSAAKEVCKWRYARRTVSTSAS